MKSLLLKTGWAITRFGEKYNLRFLTYNPIIWAFFFISGRNAGGVFARLVSEQFPEIRSALDVGAGTGGYVSSLSGKGIRTMGVEYSAAGRFLGKFQGADLMRFDCSRPESLPTLGRFDLVFSIEVGEHIPEFLSGNFVEFITRHSNFVIFSSAFPGQGGHGHINEKPKEFWQDLFEKRGFRRMQGMEDLLCKRLVELNFKGWLPHNMMVFELAGCP